MTAFLFQLSQDPVLDKVWGVVIAMLVGQALLGALGMIGFIAVLKRVVDKEIPAKLASIDETIERMDKHVADLGRELMQMRRDIDKHGYQISSLEEYRRSHLDDTRGGGGAGPTRRR